MGATVSSADRRRRRSQCYPERHGTRIARGSTPKESVMSEAHRGGSSVIERLAAYACDESFAKLPEATVRAARRAILDTLGVMLAGSREETAVRARALIEHRRAGEEAAIIGTPPPAAIRRGPPPPTRAAAPRPPPTH